MALLVAEVPKRVSLERDPRDEGYLNLALAVEARYLVTWDNDLLDLVADTELFIADSSNEDWEVLDHLREWCELSRAIDIATGYFEIGALLGLEDE